LTGISINILLCLDSILNVFHNKKRCMYMEDYYYIYKAENRSKAQGSNCDKLSFIDKFSFEKLHHKFCKAVLGIKKTSCNVSAKSELVRLSLDSFIKTQATLYYSRIQSME
jgi:hypothetical protein